MKLLDKVKNKLNEFSKMLSSVDVPNIDDPNEELPNELKEQLALADGFATKTTDMIKHKKEKSFTTKFNNKANVKEKNEKQRTLNDINKDEKERDDI